MERGFETSGACRDQGGKSFRAVIREGENYIRRRPQSSIGADVHIMVAQAYSDIVTLAAGGGYDPAEAALYTTEEATARRKAIEHYRTGFALAAGSRRAVATWREAWAILAGIPGTELYFYCMND
jgi:hypothetical protein